MITLLILSAAVVIGIPLLLLGWLLFLLVLGWLAERGRGLRLTMVIVGVIVGHFIARYW
jgi:hypothetical protein